MAATNLRATSDFVIGDSAKRTSNMTAFTDLRDFLQLLETQKQLLRNVDEVSEPLLFKSSRNRL
jgi:hypothetical protein